MNKALSLAHLVYTTLKNKSRKIERMTIMKYIIDYNTGAGNEIVEGDLEKAQKPPTKYNKRVQVLM